MTQPDATLAVEAHNGALWLVAVSARGVDMLARFATSDSADTWKRVQARTIAAAHAAGALGI